MTPRFFFALSSVVALAGVFGCESSPDHPSGGPGPIATPSADGGTVFAGDAATHDSGEPMMGMSCADGRVYCSGVCVNTSDDPRHCGRCETHCPNGQVCTSSRAVAPHCAVLANCPANPCTGFSYCDIGSTQCLPGCVHNEQCGANETCDLATHDCACAAGFHRCSGLCVSDTALGSCGMRCDACPSDPNGTSACSHGTCELTCMSGTHACGGRCASNQDVMSCGNSCTPCPTDPNGQTACTSGRCQLSCNMGFHDCGGKCVADSDVANCGRSCTPCATDPNGQATCDGHQCSQSCQTGYLACEGACAQCPAGGGSAYQCSGPTCIANMCNAGYQLCQGECAQCPANTGVAAFTCSGSSCTVGSCQSGYQLCNSACAACPTGPGVASSGCSPAGACVALSCNTGYRRANNDCLPWTYETVDDTVLDRQVRMAIDPQGNPHIAYLSNTTSAIPAVRHAFRSGGMWQTETVASVNGPDMDDSVALAIDATGQAMIAYYDTAMHYLMFARKPAGGSWSTEMAITSNTNGAFNIDLKLDPMGRPRVAYFDRTDVVGWHANYATPDFGWTTDIAGGLGGMTSGGISLAFDPAGDPHIAYSDTINLEHSTRMGSGMFTVETLSQSNGVLDVSLAYDPQGTLYAAFGVQGSDLTLLAKQNGSWGSGSTVEMGSVGVPVTLHFDSAGHAQVVYYDSANKQLKYAVRDATSWRILNLDPGSADRGRGATFVLDAADNPHIAYIEASGALTLKYAH